MNINLVEGFRVISRLVILSRVAWNMAPRPCGVAEMVDAPEPEAREIVGSSPATAINLKEKETYRV